MSTAKTAAALGVARRARHDRHQVRLRQALCGACTVHIDGTAGAVPTPCGCGRPGGHHHRRPVAGRQGPVQLAWRELNVPQCGYCQAGQIMRPPRCSRPRRTRATSRSTRDGRQHLPLRHLSADPRRHPAGLHANGRCRHRACVQTWALRSQRQPPRFLTGRGQQPLLGVGLPPAGADDAPKTSATACPTAGATTRRSSSPSPPTATSPSARHRSNGQGVRTSLAAWWWPTSWRPTGPR